MSVAVVLYSLIPLAVEYAGGSGNPFLFNMGWRTGIAIGFSIFLATGYPRMFFNKQAWGIMTQHAKSWKMLAVIVAYFDIALFALSIRFLDVSVATMVAEVSPIFLIIVIWMSYKKTSTKKTSTQGSFEVRRRVSLGMLHLMIWGLIGFAFVVQSQTGDVSLLKASADWLIPLGVILALGSALIAALNGFSFRWGTDLSQRLRSELPLSVMLKRDNDAIDLFCVVVAGMIANIIVVPFNLGIGVSLGETISERVLAFSIVGGALTYPLAGIAWRKANLITHNLGINAIGYFRPVLSLLWLAPFAYIEVASVPLLVIGTAGIVSANLLINFEADRLLGFKALVISLWGCGTWVYLRSTESWGWLGKSDAYFDILFLSATVFALILSFRVVRLATRIQGEDNRAFKVFRELEELAELGVIRPKVSEYVVIMDEKEGRDLEAAYTEALQAVNEALLKASGPDRAKLREVEVDLDILAHSRQQGINFGEICALFIFAGLVVGTALLSRPADVHGLTGFLVEMFAMLFPAVIVFLTFNVLDLQRDRIARILETFPPYGGYGVSFQDLERGKGKVEHTGRRTAEQWISVAVGLALIVAYAGLFLDKWGQLGNFTSWAVGFQG